MSTLQLLLELRSRQIATIQADYYRQQRSHPISERTACLLGSARIKCFNRRISLQDSYAVSLPFHSTLQQIQHAELNSTNLMPNMMTKGASNHMQSTRGLPITVNNVLAASYAPARAKRCNYLNNVLSESIELHEAPKSDKNFSKWLESYNALSEFRKRHGHCIVPRNFEVSTLACWVVQQRRQFRLFQDGISSSIDQKRIDMLNELGFTWDAQEASWERQMDELRVFHEKHGTCDVSRSDNDHRKLYRWIREQRRVYRDRNATGLPGGLSEKRIAALKGVGFDFDTVCGTFSARLAELIAFHQEHKHGEVTQENQDLYEWLQKIRRQYHLMLHGKGSMLQQRHIQALNKLEFPWMASKTNNSTDNHDEVSLVTTSSSTYNTSTASSEETSIVNSIRTSSSDTYSMARPLKKRRID